MFISINKLKKILNEIAEDLKQDVNFCYPEIVDKPKGKKQKSDLSFCIYEYVDQHSGMFGDDSYGHVYIPLCGKYLKIEYYS